MQKLHPKAVWVFFFRFLVIGFGVLIFAFFMIMNATLYQTLKKGEMGGTFLWWFIPIFIFYILFCYIWAKLTYRFWNYQLRESVFKIEHGVIWKKYVSIPYERIQNIDINRGLLDRIFGLSDLHIQTAGYTGSARTEGRLPGLLPEDAERLREDLITRVKGTKQGL